MERNRQRLMERRAVGVLSRTSAVVVVAAGLAFGAGTARAAGHHSVAASTPAAGSGSAAGGLSVTAAGNLGFDVRVGGRQVAPIRLSTNGALVAGRVDHRGCGLRFSAIRCKDPDAAVLDAGDFVDVQPVAAAEGSERQLEVRFRLTLRRFNAKRWQALFPGGLAPFHFLSCSMPTAQVWHQRGWLNATPNVDRFPLLGDVHGGSPEISSKWNRNWSYLCPIGGHPIPMIGAWDPPERLYTGYDFQESRATDQSARDIATAYCWRQGTARSFFTLAYPYGGLRYGELKYPHGGEMIDSRFRLIVDTNLPSTEDPNERFQARLFARYGPSMPRVPRMNDLSWIPGKMRLKDFVGPIGMNLFGPGTESSFYNPGTLLIEGWGGHDEMPVEAALSEGRTDVVEHARARLEELLTKYGKRMVVGGEPCLYWEKPLAGSWNATYGGAAVQTMHNTEGWFPARVLVELYRYDRSRGVARPEYLKDIDEIFNWTKHFTWTRNEFPDVPSSPFAIGGTLSTAFLLDYYFTFRDDPVRKANAALALHLADRVMWRYLPVWAMDSDRTDGFLDSSFLLEPNSGRDWAGLACANEVHWVLDSLTQVYVHTGDARMRYYLRGIMQRWPALYRPMVEDSIADYGQDAMTEGLGLYDGAGPGRGGRYNYGSAGSLPLDEPVGSSRMRVVAGARAAIAFCKEGADSDISGYRTDGAGGCSFRVVSSLPSLDVSFSYPFVNISRLRVRRLRQGKWVDLGVAAVRRPAQSPSSLFFTGLRNGDVIQIDTVAAGRPGVVEELRPAAQFIPAPEMGGHEASGFVPVRFAVDMPLKQDWSDPHSFAGLIPGERWVYGIPYWQGERGAAKPVAVKAPGAAKPVAVKAPGAAKPVAVKAPGARELFVVYAVDGDQPAPVLVLDNGKRLALSGRPAVAWRGWPPLFQRRALMDRVALPAGHHAARVDPRGGLLLALTAYDGTAASIGPSLAALDTGSRSYAQDRATDRLFTAVRKQFAAFPAGRVAVLPGAEASPATGFITRAGLRGKLSWLTGGELVDPAVFNAQRFPVALYLGGERYIKTVNREGDAQEVLLRYLSQGGTVVLLASAPMPLYYGMGPGTPIAADPLLPKMGLPVRITFETAPPGLTIRRNRGQTIIHSTPLSFPFPKEGDPRLRSIDPSAVAVGSRYQSLLSVIGPGGKSYGDAAGYLDIGSGPASGGHLLYVWSTLFDSPEGDGILRDVLVWMAGK